MTPHSIRWLLVGPGDIARKRVLPALAAAPGSRLEAVCGRNPEQTAAIAAELGVEAWFTSLDQALNHSKIDAVYLATPVNLHVPQAIAALEAGKHVLVEKPLGLTAQECQAVVEKAASTKLVAGCSYYRRCSARFAHAREMLAGGEFGEVVSARMSYRAWFNPPSENPKLWRLVKSESGGGPLADVGSHMLDLLIGLLGMPRKATAAVKTLVQPYAVEDSAAVLLEMENGALATGSFHWNSKTWAHEFEIVGTEASLKWIPFDSGPVIKTIGRNATEVHLPLAENAHLPLIEDFVDAVLNGSLPAVSLAEAAKTSYLLDVLYQSASEGRPILL